MIRLRLFFVFFAATLMTVLTASAAPVPKSKPSIKDIRQALNLSARLNYQAETERQAGEKPVLRQITSREAKAILDRIGSGQGRPATVHGSAKLPSAGRVVSNNGATPDKPEVFRESLGSDAEGVHLLVYGWANFKSKWDNSVFINGIPTDNKFSFQTLTPHYPESPYKLSGSAVSEFFYLLTLPREIDEYHVEFQIPWSEEDYFPVTFTETLYPFGVVYWACAAQGVTDADDLVTLYYAFDPLDGRFPSAPQFSINGVPLLPVQPVKIGSEDIYVLAEIQVTRENYEAVLASSPDGIYSVLVTGVEGELGIQWDDTLWLFDDLFDCDEDGVENAGQ